MKVTPTLERVLRVLLEDPGQDRYGYDLMKAASLQSGTLYPMLARLEDEGMLVSAWEEHSLDGADATRPGSTAGHGPSSMAGSGLRGLAGGRPPRKYYRLTGNGVMSARQMLAESSLAASRLPSSRRRPAPGGALG